MPSLSPRDRWGPRYSGEHAGTMVDPEVSLERTCMLGRFPVVLRACLP